MFFLGLVRQGSDFIYRSPWSAKVGANLQLKEKKHSGQKASKVVSNVVGRV